MHTLVSDINGELKPQVKNSDTSIFLSLILTGNLFCCSQEVINLHCKRILLLGAILPCKVHYMEMLQTIKQKKQICLHFKWKFQVSVPPLPTSPPLFPPQPSLKPEIEAHMEERKPGGSEREFSYDLGRGDRLGSACTPGWVWLPFFF